MDTLQDWKRIWKPTGEVGITLDSVIEKLQCSEEYKQQVEQLKKERDEARAEIKRLKNGFAC